MGLKDVVELICLKEISKPMWIIDINLEIQAEIKITIGIVAVVIVVYLLFLHQPMHLHLIRIVMGHGSMPRLPIAAQVGVEVIRHPLEILGDPDNRVPQLGVNKGVGLLGHDMKESRHSIAVEIVHGLLTIIDLFKNKLIVQ